MTTRNYDPAKTPGEPTYSPDPRMNLIDGPGGNNQLIENDEKGILETSLQPYVTGRQEAALGSEHDGFRQGIYSTNSMGDND